MIATALVAGTALTVWLPLAEVTYGFALRPGIRPATGPQWYATTAMIVGGELGPAIRIVFHPLPLPVLTLLWLVPVLAARRRAEVASPLRRAVLVGLCTGAVAAGVAAALPLLAPLVLPVGARSTPPPGTAGEPYATVIGNSVIAAGSLAVAVAVVVPALGRGPLRPAAAVLAAVVSGLLAGGGYFLLGVPAYCLASVTDPGWCLPVPSAAEISRITHWIIVQGVLMAAIPLVMAAAATALRPVGLPVEGAGRRGVARAGPPSLMPVRAERPARTGCPPDTRPPDQSCRSGPHAAVDHHYRPGRCRRSARFVASHRPRKRSGPNP
ncbi:hypothetical protein [Micromonospora sp. C95]|uniref:hypothetical protein n=1 Tax=Micromonospora sp. C95 TaxID=2824882 RepID=UPI001B3831E1|nr:hypothetical protein [Micromonospora sp. C95]MBQ1026544.1 hypothetical protein [Micromonospora sp. C95]